MKLEARLKKLERASGLGERCAWCRCRLRSTFTASPASEEQWRQRQAEDCITLTCQFCGGYYMVKLPADPFEREVEGELLSYKIADFYTNHRALALQFWVEGRRMILSPPPKKDVHRPNGPEEKKTTSAVRRREEMERAMVELIQKQNARCRKLYGDRFPELDTLGIELLENTFSDGELWEEQRTKQLEALAKLDAILWGAAREETLSAIEEHRKAISLRIEKDEREKAEREQRDRGFLERNRNLSNNNAPRPAPGAAAAEVEPAEPLITQLPPTPPAWFS